MIPTDHIRPLDQAMSDLLDTWQSLPPETKRNLIALVGAMTVVRTFGATGSLLVGCAMWFLSTRLPPRSTFLPFFRDWFVTIYFPKLAERFQEELRERSQRSRKSFLDSFTDRVTAWIVGTTKGVQANFVYELLDKDVKFTDALFCRLASVNIGSRSKPNRIIFIGIMDKHWFLAPWYSLNFDDTSLLEEVERSHQGQ